MTKRHKRKEKRVTLISSVLTVEVVGRQVAWKVAISREAELTRRVMDTARSAHNSVRNWSSCVRDVVTDVFTAKDDVSTATILAARRVPSVTSARKLWARVKVKVKAGE